MTICVGATDYIGGGAGALDAYDGDDFVVGDISMVAGQGAPQFYEFISTTDTENSPYLIRPDTNGTGVAWRQVSIITANATFYVTTAGSDSTGNGTSSAPWLTLENAIDWFKDKRIAADAIVTISLGSGTFTQSALITVQGDQYGRIQIVGNGSSNTTVTCATAGVGCLLITKCSSLYDIKNIKLLGDGTNGNGIELELNSSLETSADLLVDSFNRGVYIGQSCALYASSALTSQNNNNDGIIIISGAHARIDGCTFDSNGSKGVYCVSSSNVYASGSTSTNNTDGYYAFRNSFIEASSCTVSGNTTDYSPAKQTAADPTFAQQGSWIYG